MGISQEVMNLVITPAQPAGPAKGDLLTVKGPSTVLVGKEFSLNVTVQNIGETAGKFYAYVNKVGATNFIGADVGHTIQAGETASWTIPYGHGIKMPNEVLHLQVRLYLGIPEYGDTEW